MVIRQAVLDDVTQIRDLFTSAIDRWQRMATDGQVEDLPYDALSIYERWLHGGAWMCVETGALWLSHLSRGAGIALVHEDKGTITGYVEAFAGIEAAPYGTHLHIAQLTGEQTTRTALIEHLIASSENIEQITVASTVYDEQKLKFYRRFGFTELSEVALVNLAAKGANAGFYKVTEHHDADASQIEGWQMPVGRVESARFHWESLWPQLWDAVPEITARRLHRMRFNAGGQDAFVIVHEHLYNPRNAEIFCWTPKALSAHLIGAIRDWSYKTGYRTLTMAVSDKIARLIESDLETTAHQNVILARHL